MHTFLSPLPLWQNRGMAFVRVIVGLLMVYHGWEVFDSALIKSYAAWDSFKQYSSPLTITYLGKATELLIGILLTLGLFTRLAAVLLAGTMLFIIFFIGKGQIWYGDQHPFLFVLLALVFIFCGPGAASADQYVFGGRLQK